MLLLQQPVSCHAVGSHVSLNQFFNWHWLCPHSEYGCVGKQTGFAGSDQCCRLWRQFTLLRSDKASRNISGQAKVFGIELRAHRPNWFDLPSGWRLVTPHGSADRTVVQRDPYNFWQKSHNNSRSERTRSPGGRRFLWRNTQILLSC